MEQYAGIDMGGSSGSASETNRWKLFSLLRLAANSAAHFWGALLVSSGCLRSATRVLLWLFCVLVLRPKRTYFLKHLSDLLEFNLFCCGCVICFSLIEAV